MGKFLITHVAHLCQQDSASCSDRPWIHIYVQNVLCDLGLLTYEMGVILAQKGKLFLFATSPGKQPFQGPFSPEQVCVLESSSWGWRTGGGELSLPFSPGRAGRGGGITQPLFGE